MAKARIEIEKQILLMLGYLCIDKENIKSLPQKVDILDRFELADADIAKVCGSKYNSIRDARKKNKNK